MLVKLTPKNQLTIPEAILSSYPGTEYFDVTDDGGRIVLVPVRLDRADEVRSKLADLGITEKDVADAIERLRDPSDPVLDWDEVKHKLLNTD